MRRSLFFASCLLLAGIALSGCVKKPAEAPVKERPKIQEPVNTVPLEKRIYSTLEIASGGKYPLGREIVLTIYGDGGSEIIEYELEYQAGTLVQASMGSIDPANEKLPFTRDILLGSCSAGGACSYHEDVRGGILTLKFQESEVGNLRGEWNYYLPGSDGLFSSRDAKFQLKAPKLKGSYALVAQAIGLPQAIEGKVLAGPYHFDTAAAAVGNAELTLRLSEESAAAGLWRWDGRSYEKMKSTVEGRTLAAVLTAGGTYLAVEQ